MSHKRVAILRGGPSSEYEISLQSGLAIGEALKKLGYSFKDIVITKNAEWLDQGIVKLPEQALESVDIVFVALHGQYGEDGEVQRILQRRHIPYTGSRSLASAIAFNKELTKLSLQEVGIKMPQHKLLTLADIPNLQSQLHSAASSLGTTLFIKPVASGSSIGSLKFIYGEDSVQLVLDLLTEHRQLLVEEFIQGREASVGVLEKFRLQKHYPLPAVEIVPSKEHTHFSFDAKYNGSTEELCPGRFSPEQKRKLEQLAVAAHQILDCKGYSRSDFIVTEKDVYFLELNTLPGLTTESILPRAAKAVGLEFNDLVAHLVETAST